MFIPALLALFKKAGSAVLALAVIIGSIDYYYNGQKPSEEKDMPDYTRQILLSTFDKFEPGHHAPLKRVIDNRHPLNLVNYYGNEPVTVLWSSIPANQKPFTIILIIPGHPLLPNNSPAFLESTADICEANKIPYAIQIISGETHCEERLPIAYLENRFAKEHEYFYGLNGAELYNGVNWRGEIESNNSQYIIDCIALAAKYGAYFLWTDTNMNYDSGMVLEWFETNEAFYSAFKNNSEYIVLMNKESYGTPSTYSVMQGLWLAGLVGNWGVASDWWHWQVDGDKKSLFGEFDEFVDNEWDMILSYPENMYVQSMMLVISCGGTCFKAEAPNFSTSAGGIPIAGFEYGISPLLNSIISGEIQIPAREQVLRDTNAVVLGKKNYPEFNYNFAESNLYPSTGRYRIIPLLPENLRLTERTVFEENGIVLIENQMKRECFDKYFFEESIGDTYAVRTAGQWFFINNVENSRAVKTSAMKPVLSSAESFAVFAQEHTSAIIQEKSDRLSFYLSNYRTDKSDMVKTVTPEYRNGKSWVDICGEFMTIDGSGNPKGLDDTIKRTTTITVKGSLNGGSPEIVWLSNPDGSGSQNRPFAHTAVWSAPDKTLTVTINHNGVVKFDVILDENNSPAALRTRSPAGQTRNKNNNSTEALRELADSLPAVDKSDCIEYSYLKYNAALEKARVIINEGTYTKLEILEAKLKLQTAYKNLVLISKYTALLETSVSLINTSPEQPQFSGLYDDLLREVLANNLYIRGRSNTLEYAERYKSKRFNAKTKIMILEKQYNALLNEVNRLSASQ